MAENPNMSRRPSCPCVAHVALFAQRNGANGATMMPSSLVVDDLATADKRPSTLDTAERLPASKEAICNQDSCLAASVCRSLHQSSYTDLRRVECVCQAGIVVLHGRVPTFYLKQIAQELLRRFGCVRQIINSIEVDDR